MTKPAVISFEEVTFGYNPAQPVIEDASFTIHEKETLCVVGPNGGGKSTLLKLALGLLQPQKGTIRICGERPQEGRALIGYMPQHLAFDALFPARALDIVLMGRLRSVRRGGLYKKADKARAMECLEAVRLTHKASSPLAELSGGERQRVLLARALAADPQILLLDEPTSSVDVAAEEQFFEILDHLRKTMTIIMVSHDVAYVAGIVRRVLCVNKHVHSHSTERLDDTALHDLYGHEIRVIRHDHNLEDA